MIGIIDYNTGNIQSVINAFGYLGEQVKLIREAQELSYVDKIILPGVGAFGKGMENLKKQRLIDALNTEVLERKKPFLGICLGMQLICKESFEFGHFNGLGWIDASVRRFEPELGVRVPHIGWDTLKIKRPNKLVTSNAEELDVYFVHSYYVDISDSEVIVATCEYGREFVAIIEKDNIFATQFHPEKSQHIGLEILGNFTKMEIQWLKGA